MLCAGASWLTRSALALVVLPVHRTARCLAVPVRRYGPPHGLFLGASGLRTPYVLLTEPVARELTQTYIQHPDVRPFQLFPHLSRQLMLPRRHPIPIIVEKQVVSKMSEPALVSSGDHLEDLARAVSGVKGPFCCGGSVDIAAPVRVQLGGNGAEAEVTFEVAPSKQGPGSQEKDAATLVNACQKAPFGHGSQTTYNTSVRDALQLKADSFKLENFDPAASGETLSSIYHSFFLLPDAPTITYRPGHVESMAFRFVFDRYFKLWFN